MTEVEWPKHYKSQLETLMKCKIVAATGKPGVYGTPLEEQVNAASYGACHAATSRAMSDVVSKATSY